MNWLDKLKGKIEQPPAQGEDKPRQEPERPVRGTVVHWGVRPATTIAKLGQRFEPGHEITADLQIKSLLGSGGMGEVYLARQRMWDVDIALKIPNDEVVSDPENRHRIVREAEAWTDLGLHPNIAYCYYAQPLGELLLLVIEYVDGGNLRDWIADGRCADLKTGLDLAIQFCHGLEHAHKKGLVHRDIKPENVLLMKDGTLKITDFGIVRKTIAGPQTLESTSAVRSIAAGMTTVGIGTADYMAPEQWGEQSEIDHRADIFAFGVCLYEMLCGCRPYEIATGACQPAPDPNMLRGLQPLPDELARLMRQCVEWDRERRPRRAVDILHTLCALNETIYGQPNRFAKCEPVSAEAGGWNNHAISRFSLGYEADAEGSWAKALQAEPHHLDSVYNFGVHCWRKGRLTDDSLLSRLVEAQSSTTAVSRNNYLQALVHLERGDKSSALALIQSNLLQDARDPHALALQEVLLRELGESAELCHRIPSGHEYPVNCMALREDARFLVSGGGRVAALWDVETGRCCQRYQINSGDLLACHLSDDGEWVGTATHSGIEIWDAKTGRLQRSFPTSGSGESYSFSGDGRFVMEGAAGETMRLWDMASGRVLGEFCGSPRQSAGGLLAGIMAAVSMSRDGHWAFSGRFGFKVFSWDVLTGNLLASADAEYYRPILSLCSTGQAAVFATDNTIKVTDFASCTTVNKLRGSESRISALAMSANGRFVVSGAEDGSVRLWELSRSRCLRTFKIHTGPVTSVAVSADGAIVISGGQDLELQISRHFCSMAALPPLQVSFARKPAELAQAQLIFEDKLNLANEAMEAEEYPQAHRLLQEVRKGIGHGRRPDFWRCWSQLMSFSIRRRLIDAWKGDSAQGAWEPDKYAAFDYENRSGDWIAYGKMLIAAQHDRALLLGGSQDAFSNSKPVGGREGSEICVFKKDWGCVFADWGNGRSSIALRSFGEPKLVKRMAGGHDAPVTAVSLSASRRLIASASRDRTAKLWDGVTGQCLRVLEGHQRIVTSVSLSLDDSKVLSSSADGTARLWNAVSGACLSVMSGHRASVNCAWLNDVGDRALTGSHDGSIKVWDLITGTCQKTIQVGEDGASAVALGAEGRFVMVGHWNGGVSFWDSLSGECIKALVGRNAAVMFVGFTWDMSEAVSVHEDGYIQFWEMDWGLETRDVQDWNVSAWAPLEAFVRYKQRRLACNELFGGSMVGGTRVKVPIDWREDDTALLVDEMRRCGFGWLRFSGIHKQALRAFRKLANGQEHDDKLL